MIPSNVVRALSAVAGCGHAAISRRAAGPNGSSRQRSSPTFLSQYIHSLTKEVYKAAASETIAPVVWLLPVLQKRGGGDDKPFVVDRTDGDLLRDAGDLAGGNALETHARRAGFRRLLSDEGVNCNLELLRVHGIGSPKSAVGRSD